MQKNNISIVKSALTTKLPLELAYRDPGAPAPTDVETQTPAHREVQSLFPRKHANASAKGDGHKGVVLEQLGCFLSDVNIHLCEQG
jgi:hypothetical protein